MRRGMMDDGRGKKILIYPVKSLISRGMRMRKMGN